MSELCFLKSLKLTNNQLVDIEFVHDMRALEELNLSNNKIESIIQPNISYNYLGRLIRLQSLDLSGNLILSLNKEMFAHLVDHLFYLKISNNPLESDREILLEELQILTEEDTRNLIDDDALSRYLKSYWRLDG